MEAMMAKLKLSGKGKTAFKRLKAMNGALDEMNKILEVVSENLEGIIDNKKNILAEFKADSEVLSKSKKRCMIEGVPKRIEFRFEGVKFYIDFSIIASEHDDLIDIYGSIIYGTIRTMCFSDCLAPNNKNQCQRTTRCDNIEDKPLIQLSVNRQGIIYSSGELEGKWWIKDDEDLLELHYLALDLIWKEALEWANEMLLPQ
jgi:hypothetical protein